MVGKKLPNPCKRCGSSFCLHRNHKDKLNEALDELVSHDKICNEQKRCIAYKKAIKEGHGRLGYGNWRRVGYCWEKMLHPEKSILWFPGLCFFCVSRNPHN